MLLIMAYILPILPVLLLFLLGFLLQKVHFFTEASVTDVKKIVSNIALPALLFQAFASIDIEIGHLLLVLVIFATCALMVFLGKVVARILRIVSPYFAFMMGGFEMGMLGYALFLSFYGQEHLGKIALVDLGQVVFVFFVLMALLIRERDGVQSTAMLVRQFIISPVILAIFAGLLTSFAKPLFTPGPVFETLGRFVSMVASLTVPLIAITIGYGIHIKREGLMLSLKTIAVRKSLLVLLALAINHFLIDAVLHLEAMYRYALLVMFLTPPPFVISIYMAQDDRQDADYVANTLSLDTLISVLLVIVAAALYV
jgi:malate permease and related proteins